MAKYFIFGLIILFSNLVLSLPEDRDKPINISADSAVINEKENRAEYEGNVIMTQGTLMLTGDEILLRTNADGEVEQFASKGRPAKFQNLRRKTDKEPVRGQGQRIIYSYDTEIITIIGDAFIKTEDSDFSGPEVKYNLASGEVTASGDRKERVNMIMQPKKK